MKEREWTLGDTKVDELYEYKNLDVLKNYAGSFTSNHRLFTNGGKRGHVTRGNRLAIERQESFQKFASLEEELLLPSAQACWDPTRFRMA